MERLYSRTLFFRTGGILKNTNCTNPVNSSVNYWCAIIRVIFLPSFPHTGIIPKPGSKLLNNAKFIRLDLLNFQKSAFLNSVVPKCEGINLLDKNNL